jgi:hypothetical protein
VGCDAERVRNKEEKSKVENTAKNVENDLCDGCVLRKCRFKQQHAIKFFLL